MTDTPPPAPAPDPPVPLPIPDIDDVVEPPPVEPPPESDFDRRVRLLNERLDRVQSEPWRRKILDAQPRRAVSLDDIIGAPTPPDEAA